MIKEIEKPHVNLNARHSKDQCGKSQSWIPKSKLKNKWRREKSLSWRLRSLTEFLQSGEMSIKNLLFGDTLSGWLTTHLVSFIVRYAPPLGYISMKAWAFKSSNCWDFKYYIPRLKMIQKPPFMKLYSLSNLVKAQNITTQGLSILKLEVPPACYAFQTTLNTLDLYWYKCWKSTFSARFLIPGFQEYFEPRRLY